MRPLISIFTIVSVALIIGSPPKSLWAGTCTASDFDNFHQLLKAPENCPDSKSAGRYYIELTANTYINSAITIPAKTTVHGTLASDPGKPVVMESNFNPDSDTYGSGFNPFKPGKVSPPNCLVTIEDGSIFDNIQLTKVYAKSALCLTSNTSVTNSSVQGPNLDLSTTLQDSFTAIYFQGSNNLVGGVSISIAKGQSIYYATGANNNVLSATAPAPAAPAAPAPQVQPPPPAQAINTCLLGDKCDKVGEVAPPPPSPPAPLPADISKAGATPPPPPLKPIQPNSADGGGSCSLVMSDLPRTGVPASLLILAATMVVVGVCRLRFAPKRIRR